MAKFKEITKDMEGKTIYIQGNQNNRYRNGVTPLKSVVVKSVARNKAVLVTDKLEINISVNGVSGLNCGYDMYASIDDFKADQMFDLIRDKFSYKRDSDIPVDVILEIGKLLDIEVDIDAFLK